MVENFLADGESLSRCVGGRDATVKPPGKDSRRLQERDSPSAPTFGSGCAMLGKNPDIFNNANENYEHRKPWVVEKLNELCETFAVFQVDRAE